jgi:mono/diheme cytochrome c family protein
MRKLFKVLLILTGFLVIGAVAGYFYIMKALPKISDAPDIKISATPEMLKRGEYLFNNVCGCVDCHSTRDFSKYSGPVVQRTEGKGGFEFNEDFGLPGKFYAKNITPAGIGNWTDGEVFRAITEGVSKDGEPLFPLMPYLNFGKMDRNDIYAIIAYLRTLKPLENKVTDSKPKFPMNLIMRTIPQPNHFQQMPNRSNTVEYGKYITNAANCNECHTPQVRGEFQMNRYLSGGREFKLPGGIIVRPANITPDVQTGIGSWTKEQFLEKFRSYRKDKYVPPSVGEGELNTVMPWIFFAGLTDEDLSAIFDYLRTITPIPNRVTKFEKMK